MFETNLMLRPAKRAIQPEKLVMEFYDSWDGMKKKFKNDWSQKWWILLFLRLIEKRRKIAWIREKYSNFWNLSLKVSFHFLRLQVGFSSILKHSRFPYSKKGLFESIEWIWVFYLSLSNKLWKRKKSYNTKYDLSHFSVDLGINLWVRHFPTLFLISTHLSDVRAISTLSNYLGLLSPTHAIRISAPGCTESSHLCVRSHTLLSTCQPILSSWRTSKMTLRLNQIPISCVGSHYL